MGRTVGVWAHVEKSFAALGLQGMTLAGKVVAAVVAVGGAAFAFAVFIIDLNSSHPSSTGALVFPFVALYIALAVALIALIDWIARRLLGRGGAEPS
jgi:hypothetical protein